jgi:hypothetical protein
MKRGGRAAFTEMWKMIEEVYTARYSPRPDLWAQTVRQLAELHGYTLPRRTRLRRQHGVTRLADRDDYRRQ